MTKRKDGSWRTCAACDQRIRRDNATGYCLQHRHLSQDVRAQMRESERQRYSPHSAADRARSIMGMAWAAAAAAGHTMGLMAKDYGEEGELDTAYISYCTTCDRYLCVDLDESSQAYGDVVDQPCGPRPAPAETRSLWDTESAQATAAGEREGFGRWCHIFLEAGMCDRDSLDRAGW